MHITIDETKCCAAGQCVLAAPNIFDQREDDGIVILLNADPSEDQWESAREAHPAGEGDDAAYDFVTYLRATKG